MSAVLTGAVARATLQRVLLARRHMPPVKMRAANALAQRVAPFVLKSGGAQLAAAVLGPVPALPDMPWLLLTIDGHSAWAQPGHGAARRVTGLPLEGAPGPDSAMLLEDAIAPWLEEIETATGLSLRFLDLTAAPPPGGLERGWGVQGNLPGRGAVRQAGALVLSLAAAERLGRALADRAQPRQDLPGLHLRLAAALGGPRLSLGDLRSLSPGDALMLAEDDGDARLVLESGPETGFAAPARRRDGGGWQLTGPFRPHSPRSDHAGHATRKGPEMTTDPAPATGPGTALPPAASPERSGSEPVLAGLDALEMRLSFRLGETLVTLAELKSLAPGAVVTLDRPDGALVDILANGRKIGTGEVIAVAGQRAVEIRSLFADG